MAEKDLHQSSEASEEKESKQPYESPQVESIQLSQEAAEALT